MESQIYRSNIISVNEGQNKSQSNGINYIDVKRASATLRAINHKLRQAIIKLLEEKKGMTVTEIYVKLRIEQSVASQHLAILRRAEFVKTDRDGKNIHYNLNYTRLDEVNVFIKHLLKTGEAE